MFVDGLVLKEWTGVMAMSDVVAPMMGSCLLLAFGIMMYRGKLTGLFAGMSLLSGERLEEAKRATEFLGTNRVVGAAIVFSAICLFLSPLFPDKRAIFGLMVAAVIIAALAYADRGVYSYAYKGEMESWAPQLAIMF